MKVGDRVYYVWFLNGRTWLGRVVQQCGEDRYVVHWDQNEAGRDYLTYPRTALFRLCNNCDMRYADHAENEKCLYGPTSWS